MGKLRALSGQEVCQILSNYGFIMIRQKGSHIVMQKKTDTSTITVPIPNHKEIKIGTLRSIIRQSQVPGAEFEVK
ncbi:MAG: type II toxin-antitoxin system HicA family toxin [Deltaproteobacteria bacterium]|nr:type II toxin-antitoxin system HicA family toxin [Deltaproteobacteria bacterium]